MAIGRGTKCDDVYEEIIAVSENCVTIIDLDVAFSLQTVLNGSRVIIVEHSSTIYKTYILICTVPLSWCVFFLSQITWTNKSSKMYKVSIKADCNSCFYLILINTNIERERLKYNRHPLPKKYYSCHLFKLKTSKTLVM